MEHYRPHGIETVAHILSLSDKFMVYYDPDIDGGVSGRLARSLLQKFNKPHSVHINENRAHGFKLSPADVSTLVGSTIIMVDAGITKREIQWITDLGVNIINIDHHHTDEEEFVHVKSEKTNAEGVIINNQYSFEPDKWRFLSGAGVVYFVVNSLYPNLFGKDEQALVGLTLLSDVRPLGSQEANEFLNVTYTHSSPLIDYFIRLTAPTKDFGFGVQTFDRNFIDYTFSPKINALFRLNMGIDAIKVFDGTYVNGADLNTFRIKQNENCDDILEGLRGISTEHLEIKYVPHDFKVKHSQYAITNCIGLAASKHLTKTGKTTLLYVEKDGQVLRGSVRGLCEDVDYLSIFRKHGFNSEGHDGAFGVKAFDKSSVDYNALSDEIGQLERGYAQRKYVDRVVEVSNLHLFISGQKSAISDYNNYVRDNNRILLKYTGKNIREVQRGRMTEFYLDGVCVMSFEEGLNPTNGLIMPLRERGQYINFYLKKY